MRAISFITKLLAVGVPVALLAGCDLLTDSKEPTTTGDTSWEQSTDLESPYGGYAFTDETEAFGDPELAKLEVLDAGAPVADPDSVPNDSTFALRIVWGQLQGNPDATAEVDWSGSVSVSAGGLAVLRAIAFEFPGDHLLRRDNRQTVGFVSRTRPSYDGLLLLVHPMQPGMPAPADDATLTIATGPYTNTWTLAELRTANVVIPVDDQGNAISITGMPGRNRPCPQGFVRGAWLQREGERGVIHGLWIGAGGEAHGHLRGHFGITEAGDRVWFAKILGRGGRIIGLARGGWEPSSDPAVPGGTFAGHYEVRQGVPGGAVQGHYVPARAGARGAAGFFEGRWQAACDGSGGGQ